MALSKKQQLKNKKKIKKLLMENDYTGQDWIYGDEMVKA